MARHARKAVADGSSAAEEDLSLALESSLVLCDTKYPAPKTSIGINFISTAEPHRIKLFFITVASTEAGGVYSGFDASSRCTILCSAALEVGRRYAMYGRLCEKRVLRCIKASSIVYRTLCYEVF
jgi:hypothetical protein